MPSTVTANVPLVLGLTLSGAATFPAIVPAVANTYTATTTANVVSTAGNATLTVVGPEHDRSGPPGQRRRRCCRQALKARATNAANPNTAFADVSANPLTLLT